MKKMQLLLQPLAGFDLNCYHNCIRICLKSNCSICHVTNMANLFTLNDVFASGIYVFGMIWTGMLLTCTFDSS